MRLCSFSKDGKNRYGAYTSDGIIDLTSRIGDRYPTLVKLLELQGIDDARKASAGCPTDFEFSDSDTITIVVSDGPSNTPPTADPAATAR